MTRSRRRKLTRLAASPRLGNKGLPTALVAGVPLAPLLVAGGATLAHAQPTTGTTAGGLEEIVVTAQKREENLQSVPISIQALGNEKLEELKISQFTDYVKYLPSVSYTSAGPGSGLPYFRGVASGENNNHSGPSPSVGIYLDEQPITTIQGALDVHLYDIARVEAIAGPQGTLYGASSQAGTIRIITNKPDPDAFAAGYGVDGNYVEDGEAGYLFEGFVNLPITSTAAVRLVGWARHDAGYIDNTPAERVFPTSGVCISNRTNPPPGCEASPLKAEDNFNGVDTYGARAALKVDLNDNWSITPSVMYQKQDTDGSFAYDPNLDELEVHAWYPTFSEDEFTQAALTVEGKLGIFDVTYAGAYLKRDDVIDSDYTDYSFFYDSWYVDYCAENPDGDSCWDWGGQYVDNAGNLISPAQFIHSTDGYTMQSHEIRLSTPKENRVRGVLGLFYQDFDHEIFQRYMVNDIRDTPADVSITVPGWPNTLWLTNQKREDKSQAVFGEIEYDFTDRLTGTAGLRWYDYDNSLYGFFGFNENYYDAYGTAFCMEDKATYNGSPCTNLDANVRDDGTVPKLNLTYRLDDQKLVYVTYSEGFRPGGVNRNDGSPYDPDTLKNMEFGWKAMLAEGRVRVNGAIFHEQWDDIQYGFLPPGGVGLTVIRNVGEASIDGIEMDMGWAATDGLMLSGGFALLDAKLTKDYQPDPEEPIEAFKGDKLPVTPDFKANVTGRYEFPMGDWGAHAQAAVVYTGSSYNDLTRADREWTGKQAAYTLVDLAFGVARGGLNIDLYLNNAFNELERTTTGVSCAYWVCGVNPYYYPSRPRTLGLKISQQF